MLLVVGDGIRENLEDMLALLHQHPQMLFTFGLVETQIYECDGFSGRLIVPQLVARTNEVVRAVVQVEGRGDVVVRVSLPEEDKNGRTISEQEFLDSIKVPATRDTFVRLMAFAKEFGYVQCATRSVNARMPFHNTGDLRFFRLYQNGTVHTGPLGRQLRKRGLPDAIAWNLARDIASLFPGVKVQDDKPLLSRKLEAGEIDTQFDGFVSAYRRAIEQLKRLRPTGPHPPDEDELDEDDEQASN
jgi:hypothetical protein